MAAVIATNSDPNSLATPDDPLELNETGTYLKKDIPRAMVPSSYTEWLKMTRNHTVSSHNLSMAPRWRFDDSCRKFAAAFGKVEAELLDKSPPETRFPSEERRRELEKHTEYMPKMTDLLGPRLFDPNNENCATYAQVLDCAKLYAEREQICRWQGGDGIERWYYGEKGDRIIMHTEYYIDQFVRYVSFATSHALLSSDRIKQVERDAALALRNLDTIALPITESLRTVLIDSNLFLTRGCFLGHPQVDTPRYNMFNIGSYPEPRNYQPTQKDEDEARAAFVNTLKPEQLREQVRALLQQGEETLRKESAQLHEWLKNWKEERKREREQKQASLDVDATVEDEPVAQRQRISPN